MRLIHLSLAAALSLAAPAQAGLDSEDRRAAADRIAGMRNYQAFCADCHGLQGKGDGQGAAASQSPLPDFSTPQAVVNYSRQRMIEGIGGRHAGEVVALWSGELAAERIEQVVLYMREAFMLPAPVEDASRGRAIFARSCSVCHGDRGNGASWAKNSLNPPPYDFTAPKARELSRRHMVNTVTYGLPDTAMKGFATQLSRSEVGAVVDYLRATFVFPAGAGGKDGGSAVPEIGNRSAHGSHNQGPAEMSAPMPKGLAGDPGSGGAFFKLNCAICHGEKGDGQGPRAYFINPRPANFLSEEARHELNRPHLFQAISMGTPGTEMPAWSKVLGEQEIANIAEYVFTAFIRPEANGDAAAGQPAWKKKP